MKKQTLFFFSFLLILTVLVSSCGVRKKDIKAPLKKYGDKYLLKKMDENEFKFNSLSMKFSTDLTLNKKNLSFSGQLRIQHDSLIWASIAPMLGIEAMRIIITPDSVYLIDRLNSTFLKADFKYLNHALDTDLDFDIFQAILLGNDMNYYENSVFKSGIENHLYKLSTLGRRKLKKYVRNEKENKNVLKQELLLNPDNFKIVFVQMNQLGQDSKKLQMNYSNFLTVEEQLFPGLLNLKIVSEEKIAADIKYSRIKKDIELKFPFRIPDSYKKVVF